MKALQARLETGLTGVEFEYVRNVQDNSMASAQPNFPLTGGGYYNSSAFQTGPNIEKFAATVIDNRASGSTALAPGKLFVEQFTAANSGDAFYTLSATAAQAIPMFSYGIFASLVAPGTIPYTSPSFVAGNTTGQNQIFIVQKGAQAAFCTTGANAIAVGTPLIADGAGNLTAAVGGGTAPSATVATFGTAGSSTVSYQIYARNANGLDSAASTTATIATANATLSTLNGDTLTITMPTGTAQLVIVRTVGGPSQGVIAVVPVSPTGTSYTFYDTGQASQGAYAAPALTSATYPPGVVLAISKGTLVASTATPTLVLVTVGGY